MHVQPDLWTQSQLFCDHRRCNSATALDRPSNAANTEATTLRPKQKLSQSVTQLQLDVQLGQHGLHSWEWQVKETICPNSLADRVRPNNVALCGWSPYNMANINRRPHGHAILQDLDSHEWEKVYCKCCGESRHSEIYQYWTKIS